METEAGGVGRPVTHRPAGWGVATGPAAPPSAGEGAGASVHGEAPAVPRPGRGALGQKPGSPPCASRAGDGHLHDSSHGPVSHHTLPEKRIATSVDETENKRWRGRGEIGTSTVGGAGTRCRHPGTRAASRASDNRDRSCAGSRRPRLCVCTGHTRSRGSGRPGACARPRSRTRPRSPPGEPRSPPSPTRTGTCCSRWSIPQPKRGQPVAGHGTEGPGGRHARRREPDAERQMLCVSSPVSSRKSRKRTWRVPSPP